MTRISVLANIKLGFVSGLLLLLVSVAATAAIDVYEFSSQEAEDKYRLLIKELRCPKCQNQDISDSNAPIAQDMRKQVHRLVENGKNEAFIVDFMVERFGEFVSYRPVVDSRTYALWYGPLILLVLGIVLIVALSRTKKSREFDSDKLNSKEQEALEKVLDQHSSESKEP